LCWDFRSRIAATDGKILPVQGICKSTLVELLKVALALLLQEKLEEHVRQVDC
jgi:hypothetical protein